MAQLTKHVFDKALKKVINGVTIYLYQSWDLTHGYGYMVTAYSEHGMGFGFHKTNRFTAVRMAMQVLEAERLRRWWAGNTSRMKYGGIDFIVVKHLGLEKHNNHQENTHAPAESILNPERIICAAIHNPKETDLFGNPLIHCGLRHDNILQQSEQVSRNPYHQGFLTSKGRFVDREEGLIIALKNNQVISPHEVSGNKLYSENLY